ncbi:MAG: hypothetical protein HN368_21310, partial [Spirochaetales bacterium]|nr:hypothetical protein [Spirochaetales bacterium]
MRQRVLIGTILLFLLCISTSIFAQAVITVSVPSGSYSRDQRVMLESGDEVELYYSFAESRDARFVPYLFPFSLSALAGEERLYTLRVEARSKGETVKKKEFTYLIDKRAPGEPEVNIPGGTYGNQISIQFEPPPEGTENGDSESATQVYYCLNGSIQDDAVLWQGESIYLPSDEDRVLTHTIKAYARDVAGNLSELRVWSYTIDTVEELPEAGLRILSPVPGVFGNRQHLVIRSSGYEWIRYTFGGDDPGDVGTSYAGPLLVDLAGTVLLRVSGKLASTGEIRTARIEYTVDEPNVDFYQLEGGVYDEARQIQLEDRATTYYSLDDTSASRKALQYENPFKIGLVENGLKYIPLRIIREEHIQTGIAEFRYFYVLDDRTPSKPEIILDQTPPVREDTNVSISGPADARIYYTIDGTSPDVLAMEYSGSFTLDLPEESEAGSLVVKAAAFGSNGRKSENSLVLVTFDRIPPAKPEISYLDKNKTAGITIGVKGEFGSKIVYEMTLDDSLPGIPDTASLRSDDFIDLDVPYGMERMFAFRFAAMDGAGNLSEASATFRVLVDKVPPDPPTIIMQEGKIAVQGDDTLYYTITTDGSEPPLPDAKATLYIEPIGLDFEDGMLNEVKIKAVAVDKSGNASRISDTYPVLADLREPYLPDFDGIADGGVYNSSRTLTLRGTDDAVQVYYSYSISGEEPADPDADSSLLGDSLVFPGINDSETDYIIKLLPILSNGTITGDIRTISFTIDLVGPEIPVIRGVSNGKTYNRGVFVLPPLGFTDDVFLDISEIDGPLDPFDDNAIRFVSPYRLDVPEGSEKTFKLAIGAKDRADNRALNPEIYTIVIDRNPPSKPVLTGLPPGGIARNDVELAIASNYPTYYEISTDGTLPSIPTITSKKYEETLLVNGEAGREVLYTVRFLAFDEVGNGSSQSVARFTIDLKEPEKLNPPQVNFAGDSSISVSWIGVIEDMIYYSMEGLDQETFAVYEGPFTIPYDESRETIDLKYYSRDRAGNQSELGTLNLTLAGQTGDSLFSGIEDGLVYNSRQVISRSRNNEGVRYEVTTNGPIPSNTSPFSPAMPEILSFDAAPGETLRYAVRAAVFDGNESTPIQEQIIRFTIDKTPPPPPNIPDWNDEMFFQDDFQVAFETAEGAVYVSVNESSYAKYTSPLLLQSVSGGIDTYRISAYTKDEAGNQSAQIKEWLAHIDRQV